MKHRSALESPRLQKVLAHLRMAGRNGMSIRELILWAEVNDPKDCIYELRHHGVSIESVQHESRTGKKFVRYVLHENDMAREG